jgi:DNA-binding transcriptional ArsR family regulator
MLQESVDSFMSLDFIGMSTTEIVRKVTTREILPDDWGSWLEDIEEVILIPSAHIGPYLFVFECDERTARIIFGARVPKGASVSSSSLHRSELLMRLNALADDTRLHILELIAEEGELGAKEIITRLDLSQSSASRHLRLLSATGYLIERRREGAKVYRLNRDRIKNTVRSIEKFVD